VFGLDESSLETKHENHGSDQDDKVSETVLTYSSLERTDPHVKPNSLEETRRQARENWLRKQTIDGGIAANKERGAGQDAKKDLGLAQDNDVDT
jgi:hypothetical protein